MGRVSGTISKRSTWHQLLATVGVGRISPPLPEMPAADILAVITTPGRVGQDVASRLLNARSVASAHGGVASCVSGRPASQRVAQLEPTHRSHRDRPAQGCRRTDIVPGHPVDARGGRGGDGAAGAAMSVSSSIPPLPEDHPVAARPPFTQIQVSTGCTGGPNRLGSPNWWLRGRDHGGRRREWGRRRIRADVPKASG